MSNFPSRVNSTGNILHECSLLRNARCAVEIRWEFSKDTTIDRTKNGTQISGNLERRFENEYQFLSSIVKIVCLPHQKERGTELERI